MKPKQTSSKKPFDPKPFVLNCIPSANPENDWTLQDAVDSGAISIDTALPASVDLRERWWAVNNQGNTGACVGYAASYGVLRWHYVKEGKLSKRDLPSARFIWMANKETDQLTSYPTTFLETEGTQTKLALSVAQKYGCVPESVLPMDGKRCTMKRSLFYSTASKLRISSYHNLGTDLEDWRQWIASHGPILTRLSVDRTWDEAALTGGRLETYRPDTARGGHAVCIVGYTADYFIVRNSWGKAWGDEGFGYASDTYIQDAFSEAYGAVL